MRESFLSSLRLLIGIWFRPVDTLKQSAAATRIGPAIWAISFLGLAHGSFSFLLFHDGQQPGFPSIFIPVQTHYFWQGFFSLPLYFVFWLLMAGSAHATLKHIGGKGSWLTTARIAAYALAGPILLLFLLPDFLLYQWAGFDALPKLLRISAPTTLFWSLWLWVAGIRWTHGTSLPASLGIGVGAMGIGACCIGLVLR
jgi:hypothetical protein